MKNERPKFDNLNTGVLFKATFKRDPEKSPDYIGTLNVEGKVWTIFGRMRKSQDGKPFMGLSVAVPKERPEPKPAPPVDDFADDDLNF